MKQPAAARSFKKVPLEIVIGVISVTSSNTALGVELAAKEHKSLTLVESLDVAADKGSATCNENSIHIFTKTFLGSQN
jgi:hypothetical protein